MPQIQASTVNASTLFNLDGLDYQKGVFTVYYDSVVVDSSGTVEEDQLRVGLRNRNTFEPLRSPLLVSDWIDSNGDAYTTLAALLGDLSDLVGFSTPQAGGGGGIPSDFLFSGVDRAAAESARDAFFVANPDRLQDGIIIALIFGSPTEAVQQLRTSSAWIDISGGGTLTGAEISTLLYAEPDTNRLRDDEELSLRTLTDFVNTRFIPRKFGTNQYVNSALQEFDDRITSTKSIQTPDGSLFLGAQRLSNGGFGVLLTNMATDEIFYPAGVELLADGSSVPFYWALGAEVVTPAVADKSETFSGTSIQFVIPSINSGISTQYMFDSVIATDDVNLVIRANSHSDPTPIFDYQRASGNLFNFAVGEGALTLPVPLFFEQGQTLFVTVESANNIELRGQTLGGQTIPYIQVTGRLATKTLLATRDYVNANFRPRSGTIGTLTNFRIQGQATTVNPPFTLSGSQNFRFNVNNPSLIDGNLTLSQGSTVLSSTIAPSPNNFSQTVNTESINAVGESIIFTLSGTNTVGDPISSTFTITAAGSSEVFYFGTSTTNNPNGVQLASLDSAIADTGNVDISTGAVLSGDYLTILVPTDHDVHTIFDNVLGEDVTDIFTRTANVRVINTVNYNSYVIGPLNADADGEIFTLNLL